MFKVSCIIPSSCSGEILPQLNKCLVSLKRAAKVSNLAVKIFVVVDSPNMVNPFEKKIDYFLNAGVKPGFGVMNNVAINYALKIWNSDYFLLINDDAYVEENFLAEFNKVLKKRYYEIICPLIYKKGASKDIDSWGIEYFKSGYTSPAHSLETETTLTTATCVLIRKSFILKIKKKYGFVFNPYFNFYHEDVEFSIRALFLGARIYKSQKIIAYHAGKSTSKEGSFFVSYFSLRNILWVMLVTWPVKVILRNIIYAVPVYTWLLWSQYYLFFPFIGIKILADTLLSFPEILSSRAKALEINTNLFDGDKVFSPHIFRTRRKGIAI